MRELSETSQAIARYLVEYGTNEFTLDGSQTEGFPGHYTVKTLFNDGRKLRAYFCDINNAGVERPMRNSRLEISLDPVKEDQWGFQTQENGLTGRFESLRVSRGKDIWKTFLSRHDGDATRDRVQKIYSHFMESVYAKLTGKTRFFDVLEDDFLRLEER
ncbi:hypothetical protein HYV86_07860 [Candidatus Woesearchaeota archaeon]|nr:hypothetical protein [Candidatus Woesearchaeota archaeon]